MPSSLGHAMVPVAMSAALAPKPLVRAWMIAGAACAVVPDIDAIGRPFYGADGDIALLGGHRGFTHSLAFAALLGIVLPLFTIGRERWDGARWRFGVFIAIATASHGALDFLASTGAREGVQFLSPFSTHRFTQFAWHPIQGPFTELVLLILPLAVIAQVFHNPRWRE